VVLENNQSPQMQLICFAPAKFIAVDQWFYRSSVTCLQTSI
jgi:hypothetical protein